MIPGTPFFHRTEYDPGRLGSQIMTDEHDPQTPSSTSSKLRYEVVPWRSPSTFAVPHLLLLVLAVVLLAFALGWLAQWPDKWLENIEWVWTIALGFAMGLLGALAVHRARLRHGGLAALCGLVGGALAVVAMHYWQYRDTLPHYEAMMRRPAATLFAAGVVQRAKQEPRFAFLKLLQVPPPPRPVLTDHLLQSLNAAIEELVAAANVETPLLEKAIECLRQPDKPLPSELTAPADQAAHNVIARFGFVDYMDLKATLGVPLSLPKVRQPIILGHTASLIYWSIEMLIAGGIAAGLFYASSQRPACSNCDNWLDEKPLGRLRLNPDRAVNIFQEGMLIDLAGEDLASPDGAVLVQVGTCADCGEEATITVQLFRMVKNDKGKDDKGQLTELLLYPGSALPVLKAMVELPPSAPPS
jgi:hypothetical protein